MSVDYDNQSARYKHKLLCIRYTFFDLRTKHTNKTAITDYFYV